MVAELLIIEVEILEHCSIPHLLLLGNDSLE